MSHWRVAGMLVIAGWLGPQSAPQPTAFEALAQAEARWQQRKPLVYEFGVEVPSHAVITKSPSSTTPSLATP
jgi:hypothetical protein